MLSIRTTGSTSPGEPPKRLPTHRRRNKVPAEKRKRVAVACDSCNVKRIKCTGERPCRQCQLSQKECTYPPPAEKKMVKKTSYEELQMRCKLLQAALEEAVPTEEERQRLMGKWRAPSQDSPESAKQDGYTSSREEGQDTENEKDEGRILQDPDGYRRYMGESAGAAFMDRLREFVKKALVMLPDPQNQNPDPFSSSIGSYHTLDSRILELPTVDPGDLPGWESIFTMIETFRYFIGDGGNGCTSGGIYFWGNMHDLVGQVQEALMHQQATLGQCILNAVLALACEYEHRDGPITWENSPGRMFFARSKILLGEPMEDATIPHMRALNLMALYLVTVQRRDAAYMYIGLAVRVAVAHGLHRGWGITKEKGKREFWNIFILDRWLSCLMGRPVMIPDEAISIELPMDVPNEPDLPPAAGLRAHVQLSFIMGEIISEIYGVTGREHKYTQVVPRIEVMLTKLEKWREELPPSARLNPDGVTERAIITLHMIYNQLVILSTRPSLFVTVKQTLADRYYPSQRRPSDSIRRSHVAACIDAARRNVQLTRELEVHHRVSPKIFSDYHYTFNAGVILQLSQLLDLGQSKDNGNGAVNVDQPDGDITFIIQYLERSAKAGNESAQDCELIIVNFAAVTRRLLNAVTAGTGASAMMGVTQPQPYMQPQPTSEQPPNGYPIFYPQQNLDSNMAMVVDPSLQGVCVEVGVPGMMVTSMPGVDGAPEMYPYEQFMMWLATETF